MIHPSLWKSTCSSLWRSSEKVNQIRWHDEIIHWTKFHMNALPDRYSRKCSSRYLHLLNVERNCKQRNFARGLLIFRFPLFVVDTWERIAKKGKKNNLSTATQRINKMKIFTNFFLLDLIQRCDIFAQFRFRSRYTLRFLTFQLDRAPCRSARSY